MFSPRSPRRHRVNSKGRKVAGQRMRGRKDLRVRAKARRAIAPKKIERSCEPPEDWYAETGQPGYRVVVKEPGSEYRHVVTPAQIRSRLAKLPKEFLRELEVVQLSTMTRRKNFCPCYGLQWGRAIYLYPFDETLDEYFYEPPPKYLVIETKMYGGRWEQHDPGIWRLVWTESSARDFQLNNVLIHELGHLIDKRNSNCVDQERFAEWFAIEYGYRRSGGSARRRPHRHIRRRHHRS